MRDKIASCKTFLPFNAFLSTEGIVLTFIQTETHDLPPAVDRCK